MRYLLAVLLIACSTAAPARDASVNDAAPGDAGPPNDADSRTCATECHAPTSCAVTTCVPSHGDFAYCQGCAPSCPSPNHLGCGFSWGCIYPDGGEGGGVDGRPVCVTR